MTRKEINDLWLSKIADDQKEAFIEEIRKTNTKEERLAVIKKFGISLTQEEKDALKSGDGNEISDEELDTASGGCCASACHVSSCGIYCQ